MLRQIKLLPKINTIRNKVVYVHTRQSDNLPFYIGIGSHKRPFHITGRNTNWNETHTTHGMNPPVIIHKNLLEWAAISIELALITSYKKLSGHNNPSFNKTAHLSPSFQGNTIGYNQTHIFSTSNISSCINGSHTIPEELLHLVPFNDLSKQRLHASMHRSQS